MRPALRVAVSCALLAGALVTLELRSTGEAVPIRKPLTAIPTSLADWRGRESTLLDERIVGLLKVDDYVMRRYEDEAGRSLWLYVGYWQTQRKGAQIHSPRNCLPGAGWEPLEAARVTIPLPAPHAPITVNRYLVQKDRDQQLVFYWYHSQGRAIPGEVEARIELVRSAIARNRTDGALVRISGPIYGSAAETSERMVRYIQALYPLLAEYLPD